MDETTLDTQQEIYNDISRADVQYQDQELKPWIECVRLGQKPKRGQFLHNPLYRQFEHLDLLDGKLYKVVKDRNGNSLNQLVLPSSYTNTVMEALHNEMGHSEYERTT